MYKTKISGFVEDSHVRVTLIVEQILCEVHLEPNESVQDTVRNDFERFLDKAMYFYGTDECLSNHTRHVDLEKVEKL